MSDKTKECNKCNQVKPTTEFSVHPATKDGRQYSCKACIQARYHERYAEKRKAKTTGVMQPWYIFD